MINLIIGAVLLILAVFLIVRIFKSIIEGVILIAVVVLACYFIFGGLPDLAKIPLIGPAIQKFIPKFPTSLEEIIVGIKGVAYSIDILGISRDAADNLLITVTNTGKATLSDFKVYVDNKRVDILNEVKDLSSGETTVLQVDWKEVFSKIEVQTKQEAKAEYKLI
ncbi:MAG: hypothetical protein QMD14_03190 [Candidatus Aenigmarchaeota archaeon]|nr:hypothetical protein [Candidatus Aenigmarchaeota archaeon]